MTTKRRLSASVDADLLTAAEIAVRSGRAPSVSAWVNQAFRKQIEHDRRLEAMDARTTYRRPARPVSHD